MDDRRTLPTKIDVAPGQFEAAVLKESRHRPVVVDFWAPWCGPCRTLGPVLERLAAAAGGAWLLAKVNVDEDQEVAARFQVQGIPAVKAFRDGALADEFVGALPEAQVRRWLEGLVPSPADEAFAAAQPLLSEGDGRAREALEKVLALEPTHAGALAALAELDLKEGERERALARLELISPDDAPKLGPAFAALKLRARATGAQDLAALRRRVEEQPGDAQARLSLGRALAASGDYETALGELLEVVRRVHRAEPGEEARRAMLELFEVVGSRSELADHYRTKLSRELYR